MTTGAAIVIRELSKRFRDAIALDGVSLDVPQGSIFGFLGPNGAGKTTTIRILTGLARATGGSARVLGRDVTRIDDDLRAKLGFLPDVPGFYGWMTGREFLMFAGRLFGLAGTELADRADALLDMAGLAGVRTRIAGYSRGMKQRLGIAQALINAPTLLFLDEPTSALDPIGRREVLEMIASLRGRTTVFFSTHILADVERVCDTAAILDRGRVVASAPVSELKQRAGVERILVTVTANAGALADRLRPAAWLTTVDVDGLSLHLTVTDRRAAAIAIPKAVAELAVGLDRLDVEEVSLEDVFVELVGHR